MNIVVSGMPTAVLCVERAEIFSRSLPTSLWLVADLGFTVAIFCGRRRWKGLRRGSNGGWLLDSRGLFVALFLCFFVFSLARDLLWYMRVSHLQSSSLYHFHHLYSLLTIQNHMDNLLWVCSNGGLRFGVCIPLGLF